MLNKERVSSNWLLDIWVEWELIKSKGPASLLACSFYSAKHLWETLLSFLLCVMVIMIWKVLSSWEEKKRWTFICCCLGDYETKYLLNLQLILGIPSGEKKMACFKCKREGRWISTMLMLVDPPTCFNLHLHFFFFPCCNLSLQIVRIILQMAEGQKWCKLHCPSISDTHILLIYSGCEDYYPWLWASESTV